jgi:hypothetical protein
MKSNHKAKALRDAGQRPVLGTIGAAVLATLMSGGVQAAGTDVGGAPFNTGHDPASSVTSNHGPVAAGIDGGSVVIDTGTQTGSSNTINANSVKASATGNSAQNSVDLGVIASPDGLGTSSLAVQGNSEDASVNSTVTNSRLAVQSTSLGAGSVTNTANTISASTTLNSATSVISGDVPVGVALPTAGTSTFGLEVDAGGSGLGTAAGGIVATSFQQSFGGVNSSGAHVDGNEVAIQLAVPANPVSGPDTSLVLDQNAVAATFKGNTARNSVSIGSGDAPSFAGSAVVTNLQSNVGDFALDGDATASNTLSVVGAQVFGSAPGTVSVDSNSISSSSTGNEAVGATAGTAGNQIVLGAGLSIAGAGGATVNRSSLIPSVDADPAVLSSTVSADLAIVNGQSSEDANFSSLTQDGLVTATVQTVRGGQIDLATNTISASAKGNDASSALATTDNGATLSATSAIANHQVNQGTAISAVIETTGAASGVLALAGTDDGTVADSTVAVTGNAATASAYGNRASQSIALAANSVPLSAGAVSLASDSAARSVSATGAATITNLQANISSPTTAQNQGIAIGAVIDSGGVNPNTLGDNTVAVGANVQEAVAVGNSGNNGLSLTGNSVGSGAGIASAQTTQGSSVSAEVGGDSTSIFAGTHVADSTLALTGNTQQAIGYGNTVANELTVDSGAAIVSPATAGVASTVSSLDPSTNAVSAGFGIQNSQTSGSAVGAQASSSPIVPDGPTALAVFVEGGVAGSTLGNTANSQLAAAVGNDASNVLSLDANGIGSVAGGASSVANVTSVQAAASSVSASSLGRNVVLTHVEDDVTGSTLNTSGNAITAQVAGNQVINRLLADGNAIDTAVATTPVVAAASVSPEALSVSAALSLANAQTSSGAISATHVIGLEAASIRTEVGTLADGTGAVAGSTIASSDNKALVSAVANTADNGLGLTGTNLSTTSALANSQVSASAVTAQSGLAAQTANSSVPFNYSVQSVGNYDSDTELFTGLLRVNTTGLSSPQIAYLTDSGWSVTGTGIVTKPVVDLPVAAEDISAYLTGTQVETGLAVTTTTTPAQGGVTIAVAGPSVTNSQLSVERNSNTGSVVANSASNQLAVKGDAGVAPGTARTASEIDASGIPLVAQADHSLVNSQASSGALVGAVHGAFSIDAAAGTAISGSTLSIADNTQGSSVTANTAANQLDVSGNGVSAGSALASQQSSNSSVAATSGLTVYAPAAAVGSSIKLTGNTNYAAGVLNDATNALTVSAANAGSLSGTPASVSGDLDTGTVAASGDHVLGNQQQATTSVTSTANTSLYNQDSTAVATTGIDASSLAISGNRTQAEATANRASNSLVLNATAALGASGGLSNAQTSSAAVTASASTTAGATLSGAAGFAALNQGSISLDGNVTVASASGNVATNVLNATAGAGYGATSGTAAIGFPAGPAVVVDAQAALLNSQLNEGAVQSTAGAAGGVGASSYLVALNATGAGSAIAGSSVGVTGNSVASQAYGNKAGNTLTVAALGTGTPSAAVGNYQVNTAAVSAVTYGAGFGISGNAGTVSGSSLYAGGNQITATAVGNSAVTAIAAAR